MMGNVDPAILQRILSIDWVSIFLEYARGGIVSQEFRLKERKGKIELATRQGNFLPRWHGYIVPQKDPVMHLTKLDGNKVALDVPIPPSDSPRETFITKETPLGRIRVLFTKSLADGQEG